MDKARQAYYEKKKKMKAINSLFSSCTMMRIKMSMWKRLKGLISLRSFNI